MTEFISHVLTLYTWYLLGVIGVGFVAIAMGFYKLGESAGLQDGWRKGWNACQDGWIKREDRLRRLRGKV